MGLSRESFDKILRYVRPTIAKQDTHLRQAISAEQRLCITLYHLATGDSFHTPHLFSACVSLPLGMLFMRLVRPSGTQCLSS